MLNLGVPCFWFLPLSVALLALRSLRQAVTTDGAGVRAGGGTSLALGLRLSLSAELSLSLSSELSLSLSSELPLSLSSELSLSLPLELSLILSSLRSSALILRHNYW